VSEARRGRPLIYGHYGVIMHVEMECTLSIHQTNVNSHDAHVEANLYSS